MKKIKKLLDINWVISEVVVRNPNLFSDKKYLKALYYIIFGKRLNLNNPQTFNEKLNWLKLNDRNPLYSTLVDKFEVKKFVASIIGNEYVVKTYGVWSSSNEIDLNSLPNKFVLKTTHDSSGSIICKDKSKFDFDAAKIKLDNCLKNTLFLKTREWPYKQVNPRIIADEYLEDGHHTPNEAISLNDYKFWCFNGVPKMMYITVKDEKVFENFYDKDFNPVHINHNFDRLQPEFEKPEGYEEMWNLAGKLSTASHSPFVRVDFFNIRGKIYFGEFTFYDWAGLRPFVSDKQDYELGSWINIQNV